MSNEKAFKMKFSKVYPLLVQKVECKGRTKAEVDEVICWLTGYDEVSLQSEHTAVTDFEQFFADARAFHRNSDKITGVICGHRVENITEPLMKKIRQMDKMVDELAKGKAMEKILRQ